MYKSRQMASQKSANLTSVNVDGIEFIVEFNGNLITLSNKELDLKFLYGHTNAFDVKTTKIDDIGFSNYNGTVHYQYIYAFLTELDGKNKQPKETKVFLKNKYRYEHENSKEFMSQELMIRMYMVMSDMDRKRINDICSRVEMEEELMKLRIKAYLAQRKTDAEIKELHTTIDELRSQLAKLADK